MKGFYFDQNGKPHDCFILNVNSDKTAKILFRNYGVLNLWTIPEIDEQEKGWTEIDNVSPKEIDGKLIAEQIIEIENENGKEVEHIRGIKNCYKIIGE